MASEPIEQLKTNPDDFGGIQTTILTAEEGKQRLCARRFCGDQGRVQILVPGEDPPMWRIICARHFVMIMLIQAAVLGDPSPIGEGKRLAEKMGIPADLIPGLDVPQIVNMGTAICGVCGEGMIQETIGMFKGRRFVHTCPDSEEVATSSA